jgi:predicted DNA-binding ribbon-helix-helix protein
MGRKKIYSDAYRTSIVMEKKDYEILQRQAKRQNTSTSLLIANILKDEVKNIQKRRSEFQLDHV